MSTNSPPSGRRQRLILTVLIFAQLLIWIDGTVLSTAYETLADPVRGLGATPGQLQWATGSYTLVLATVTFTGGALGDRFGHRNTLLAGMALFGLASVFAAYSQNTGQLIAARAVMGLGAALLIPATLAVISFTYPPEQRPQAFGVLSSFAGVGIAAGPVLAGLMLANFWWGSVFLINVPVVVLGLVAIARTVPNFQPPAKRGLDFPGLLLSSAGLGLLSYGLIRAGQDGTVTEPQVWITVAGGLAVTAAFVVVELRRRHPSFDPRLFRLRQFAAGNVSLTLLFLALSASGFYFAFYLQGARGYSALARQPGRHPRRARRRHRRTGRREARAPYLGPPGQRHRFDGLHDHALGLLPGRPRVADPRLRRRVDRPGHRDRHDHRPADRRDPRLATAGPSRGGQRGERHHAADRQRAGHRPRRHDPVDRIPARDRRLGGRPAGATETAG